MNARFSVDKPGTIVLWKMATETTHENSWVSLDTPTIKKSNVWTHFGFPVYDNEQKKITDKQKTACRQCKVMVPYNGITKNMRVHLKRHRPNITPDCVTDEKKPISQKTIQANLPSFPQYFNSSSRAADIDRAVAGFIVSNMIPQGIVDNLEFKLLLQKLDLRYILPCR